MHSLKQCGHSSLEFRRNDPLWSQVPLEKELSFKASLIQKCLFEDLHSPNNCFILNGKLPANYGRELAKRAKTRKWGKSSHWSGPPMKASCGLCLSWVNLANSPCGLLRWASYQNADFERKLRISRSNLEISSSKENPLGLSSWLSALSC